MLRTAARRVSQAVPRSQAVGRSVRSRGVRTEAEEYQQLAGRDGFFGTALEQRAGTYQNEVLTQDCSCDMLARSFCSPTLTRPPPVAQKFHEQDELWWDDGTAIREPIFDSDYIPLSEAVTHPLSAL